MESPANKLKWTKRIGVGVFTASSVMRGRRDYVVTECGEYAVEIEYEREGFKVYKFHTAYRRVSGDAEMADYQPLAKNVLGFRVGARDLRHAKQQCEQHRRRQDQRKPRQPKKSQP